MHRASLVKELSDQKSLPDKLYYLGAQVGQRYPLVERFSVALYQPASGLVRTFFTTSLLEEAISGYEFPLKQASSLYRLAEERLPRVINDLSELVPPKNKGRVNPHTLQLVQQGWKASFTAPMLSGNELVGFVFFNSRTPQAFSDKLFQELELYSQLIAQLIYQEHDALRTLTAAVRATLSLCSSRDPETGNHLERMAQYTQLIAANLAPKWAFSDRQIQHLLLFAPLHDLGKVGIPDQILLKKGKLTDDEFKAMQEHTTLGVQLLEKVISHHGLEKMPDVQVLKNIVLHHHEKMDGSGYPAGLKGEAIPIEARIIAVADVFDALTSERPYKRAWTSSEAITEMQRVSGTHLDPDCVAALVDNLDSAEVIMQHRF